MAVAAREPGRLRIAALEEAGALLRELGHEVMVRDPDYPPHSVSHALSRYFRGVYDDVQRLARPDRLDAHTRSFARIGGMLSDRRMARIRAAESQVSQRVQSIYDDVDVVITPGSATGPSRIGAYQQRGAVSTLALVAARAPFQAMFNVTGQPAAAVPVGSRWHRRTEIDPVGGQAL